MIPRTTAALRVTALLDGLTRPRLGEAASGTGAALASPAPELACTFERLGRGSQAVGCDALAGADADPEAVRAASYSDRYDRALRDPFPDGVVDLDFVFARHLHFIDMEAVDRIFRSGKTDLGRELQRFITTGPKRPRPIDGLQVSVEKAPKREDGRPFEGLDAKDGPFLVIRGEGPTTVAHYSSRVRRLEISTCEDGIDASLAMAYEPRSVFERLADMNLGGDLTGLAPDEKLVSRFRNGATDLEALVRVARAVRGGAPQAEDELLAARAAKSEVLTRLVVAGEWIDRFRQMAELVKVHGEQSTGDGDNTLQIADRMEWTSCDDDDEEHTEVLLEGHGPLFVCHEHAGDVSHAVSLDALERGELKLWIVRDGVAPVLFEVGADGRLREPNADYVGAGIDAVAFEVSSLPGQLAEMLDA